MPKSVVGAQLYTIRQFTQSLPEIKTSLKKISQIGYRVVQVSGFGKIDSKEVAALLEDNELICASTHLQWSELLNDFDRVVAEHKLWNCTHPVIAILPKEYNSLDGLDKFLNELPAVAEALIKEGMDLSYHNHSHELAKYGDKTWLELLYERADPTHLKAEIDTYWIQHGGGDPALWVKNMTGRQPLLHLKDMIVTPQKEQRYAEIGAGNLNWPAILEQAAEGGVEWYFVEQDQCYDKDPFESLAISYRYLKSKGLS